MNIPVRTFIVSSAICISAIAAEAPQPASHSTRVIEGWTVRIDDRLLGDENKAQNAQILKSLESRLAQIKAVVGEKPLGKLQGVTIVLDASCGGLVPMQYHPSADWLQENGYPRDLARCVHIPVANALIQPSQINVQPWCVLHELAHAYHDQVIGFEDARVLAIFKKYQASGNGDKTLHINGERVPHYALTNHKEFFAEMTESYFGTNDFFPFNYGELKEAEPETHKLMQEIWGQNPSGR
jgi:hypothetical protein